MLRLGDILKPIATGFDLDLSRPDQHKTSAAFGHEAAERATVDQAGQGRVQGARGRAARAQGAALLLHHLPPLGAQLGRGAQVGRLRHAALVGAGARAGLYDKERAERLSAAAVAVATDFAAGFK